MAKSKQTIFGDKRGAADLARSARILTRTASRTLDIERAGLQKQREASTQNVKDLLESERLEALSSREKTVGEYTKKGAEAESMFADTNTQNIINSARERSDALAVGFSSGLGATDALRIQAAALRSKQNVRASNAQDWNTNLANLNSSILDADQQTRAALTNAGVTSNLETQKVENQYWSSLGNSLSDAINAYGSGMTDLQNAQAAARKTTVFGNTKGRNSTQSQKSYETAESKKYAAEAKKAQKIFEKLSEERADLTSNTYEGKPLTAEELGYTDSGKIENRQTSASLGTGGKLQKVSTVTGSKLRKRLV